MDIDREFWKDCGMPISCDLTFDYTNYEGESTRRRVTTTHFTDTGQILGHCHLRNAEREFRIDSIDNCVDTTTRQPIANLYDHLFDLYEQTPEHSFDQVWTDHIDKLRALLYILEYSGFDETQRVQVIQKLCQQLGKDDRITTASAAKIVVQYRRAGLQSYKLTVGRLSKTLTDREKAAVQKLANKIATQFEKQPNQYTQEALNYIAKRFSE